MHLQEYLKVIPRHIQNFGSTQWNDIFAVLTLMPQSLARISQAKFKHEQEMLSKY
jgi:hypothetical protein